MQDVDVPTARAGVISAAEGWPTGLAQLRLSRKPAEDALTALTQAVGARHESATRNGARLLLALASSLPFPAY
jgi:hypothetical protein